MRIWGWYVESVYLVNEADVSVRHLIDVQRARPSRVVTKHNKLCAARDPATVEQRKIHRLLDVRYNLRLIHR